MNASQQRQAGSFGDELTNAALIGLIGMFGVALLLRASGSVAALLTGTPSPRLAQPPGSGCCSTLPTRRQPSTPTH